MRLSSKYNKSHPNDNDTISKFTRVTNLKPVNPKEHSFVFVIKNLLLIKLVKESIILLQ